MKRAAHVLVVAGSDSSGGAGVGRDIETIAAFGLHACLAVTAVTVQTHGAINRVEQIPPDHIAAQMRAALAANTVASIKIGMLGTAAAVAAVSAVLTDNPRVPTVLDPVLASTSGHALIEEGAVDVLRSDLMPLCRLVTPNLVELAKLTGPAPARDEAGARLQGEQLARSIGCAVLVKGGHATGAHAVDLLVRPGLVPIRFEAPRLAAGMRGTGCMLSSAIAAGLALGLSLEASVGGAKRHVFEALKRTS